MADTSVIQQHPATRIFGSQHLFAAVFCDRRHTAAGSEVERADDSVQTIIDTVHHLISVRIEPTEELVYKSSVDLALSRVMTCACTVQAW